jgi:hypothetical protein
MNRRMAGPGPDRLTAGQAERGIAPRMLLADPPPEPAPAFGVLRKGR